MTVLKPWRRLDLAGALVVFIIQLLKVWLLLALGGVMAGIGAILVLGVAETLSMLLVMYLVFILIRSILSWVGPSPQHPVIPLLIQLTEPVLRPFRRLLPAMGGFDLSPLLALLVILLARALIVAPLLDWGAALMQP